MVLAQQWDPSALSFTQFWFAKGFFLPVPLPLGKWSPQDGTHQPTPLHFSSPQKSWELSTILTSLLPTRKEISSLPSHTHHGGPDSVSSLTPQSDPGMHCVGSWAEFWIPLLLPPLHTLWQGPPLPSSSVQKNELVFVLAACTLDPTSPALCLTWLRVLFCEKGGKRNLRNSFPYRSLLQVSNPLPQPACMHLVFRVLSHCFIFKARHPHYFTFLPCLCSWPSNQALL